MILPIRTEAFKFAVAGCWHYPGMNNHSNVTDFYNGINSIKNYKPDFVLFLGSMVDSMSARDINDLETRWKAYKHAIERLKVPVYDVPSERSTPRFRCSQLIQKKSAQLFAAMYPRRYYSFFYEDALFICLDSETASISDVKYARSHRPRIEKDQLEYLKRLLELGKGYRAVFIAIHASGWNDYFEREKTSELRWVNTIHPMLKKLANVYVFGACIHRYRHEIIDGINYYTTGGFEEGVYFLCVNAGKKIEVIRQPEVRP